MYQDIYTKKIRAASFVNTAPGAGLMLTKNFAISFVHDIFIFSNIGCRSIVNVLNNCIFHVVVVFI